MIWLVNALGLDLETVVGEGCLHPGQGDERGHREGHDLPDLPGSGIVVL